MRKLMRTKLPDEVQRSLLDAMSRGLAWDDFDKRQVRGCLRAMQSGFCAYCERKLDPLDARTRIDHFVPQSSAKGASRVFDWTNHYLSCDCRDTCDSHKSNDEREIVNPDTEDPVHYLTYLPTGSICAVPDIPAEDARKAQETIEVLNLDCRSLAYSRVIAFNRILKHSTEPVLREFIRNHVVEFHTFCEFMLSRKRSAT